jgi:hypothetical protein
MLDMTGAARWPAGHFLPGAPIVNGKTTRDAQ